MARKAKVKKRSLSEGLARSATKRGLTGEARERYIIGGAINAEKRHEAKLKRGKAAKAGKTTKPASAGGRERLELVTRKNAEQSEKRGYEVFSLYKGSSKTPYNSAIYRKRGQAQQAAKFTMEEYNHPKGVHTQNRLA